MRPLQVLYLHLTGSFGGSSRSLFEAVRAMPDGAVAPMFVTQRGTVSGFFGRLGPVVEARGLTQFDDTRYSHYRGARWLVVLRELAYLPSTLCALREAKRRGLRVDLIHLNEFTGLVPLWLAQRYFAAPAVVHVRSLARHAPQSWRWRKVQSMLADPSRSVVAIDESVRASLPAELPVEVIHNAFSAGETPKPDPRLEGRLATLRAESFKVGFVGNLLRVKGIHELVEAARLTKERGFDIEFIVIGDDARPSRGLKASVLRRLGLGQSMRDELEAAIDRHALRDRFHLMGFSADIGAAYRRMDALCFPSHYDAPGRPVFEAAFFGVPAIVAVRRPQCDTLVDGVTGIAVEPGSALQLADAIGRLASDRALARRMGAAARELAEACFDPAANAARLLALYRRIVPAADAAPANGRTRGGS